MNVPVFSFYRHACNSAEIVGMVIIGGNAVKKVEMEAADSDHVSGIAGHPVVVAFRILAFEFVFMQVIPHTNLLFVSAIIFCTITAFIINDIYSAAIIILKWTYLQY